MDEDFVPDVRLDTIGFRDDLIELLASRLVVSTVSVDDIDEGATTLDLLDSVLFEHVVTGEVDHVEFDILVVADLLHLHIGSWHQEECLMRRHLLENDLGDGSFARPFTLKKM